MRASGVSTGMFVREARLWPNLPDWQAEGNIISGHKNKEYMDMRKIFYIAALLPAFILYSCVKNPGTAEPDPIDPGRMIYSFVVQQNDPSIAPVDMAFRLNALLNEAQAAGVAHTVEALRTMKVTLDRLEVYAFSYLFPDGVLRDVSDGTYTFEVSSITRNGRVIISTGGKLLEEEGSSWTVSLEGRMSDDYVHSIPGNMKTYDVQVKDDGGFTISKAADKQEWEICFSGLKLYSRDYSNTSDWSGAFTVARSSSTAPMGIAPLLEAVFNMGGSASGATFHGLDMTYEIDEGNLLRLNYKCYSNEVSPMFNMITAGGEKAAFAPGQDINTDFYTARDVSVEWRSGVECGSKIKISYDGLSSN